MKNPLNLQKSMSTLFPSCLVFLLYVLALQSTHAATINVSAEGYTSLGGLSQTPVNVVQTSLPGGAKSITAAGSIRAESFLDPPLEEYSASFSGYAEAGSGFLKARVSTLAVAASFVPNVPALLFTPLAHGRMQASFREMVELKHPTLALGSPALYRATLDIASITNDPSTGSFNLQFAVGPVGGPFQGVGYAFPNGLFRTVPSFNFAQTFDVPGVVGEQIVVFSSLSVSAGSRAGPDGFGGHYGRDQHTLIDASNTIRVFLDPITPGLSRVSETGHNYAVPLPAAVWLFGSGLLGLVGTVRWRRKA